VTVVLLRGSSDVLGERGVVGMMLRRGNEYSRRGDWSGGMVNERVNRNSERRRGRVETVCWIEGEWVSRNCDRRSG
jgi:hypothetical protein